ncbi:MAG TPA: serine/threonine-protein kinase [Planktothrix sp.]
MKQDRFIIEYADRGAYLALWWKTIFLMPFWGLLLFPLMGTISLSLNLFFGEFVYLMLVFSCIAYFLDDWQQKRIRVQNGRIKFGFQRHNLSDLQSIGTEYVNSRFNPDNMVLSFKNDASISLALKRLSLRSVDQLIEHVEATYPQCQIDPTLIALMHCQKTARKILVETDNKLVIPYNGRRHLQEIAQTFFSLHRTWLHIGPAIAFLFCTPIWFTVTAATFFMARPAVDTTNMENTIVPAMFGVQGTIIDALSKSAAVGIVILSNPIVWAVSFACILFCAWQLLRVVLLPKSITVDDKGIFFDHDGNGPALAAVGGRITWDKVISASLVRDNADLDNYFIRFNTDSDKSKLDVDISALEPSDRPRLLKAVQRVAPHCIISANLSEALMPKQERSYTQLWLQSLTSTPQRSTLQALQPGQTLQEGRYCVLRRLGIGGQATAYLCRDEGTKTSVVLKETIIPVFADRAVKEQAILRFEAEGKMLQALHHDNIVKLDDFFYEDHRCFLVLEHIDGKNLRQYVSEKGQLPEEQVRRLAGEMCNILLYLHEKNVVHRDFTPDNLIMRNDGSLTLIDFNIAQQSHTHTTGTIAGKHSYLPPEQFRGKATTQSDVYAFGATLYYLLTGTDPEPITQSSVRKNGFEVSELLDNIIMRCTALDCNRRVSDLNSVLHDLGETANNGRTAGGSVVDAFEAITVGNGDTDDSVISGRLAGAPTSESPTTPPSADGDNLDGAKISVAEREKQPSERGKSS